MKNLDRVFWSESHVNKWFSNSNLLPESKEERTEVISRLLFIFVAHKLQKHLNFSDTFSYLFHNYDVTSLENIPSVTFWKYAKRS